MPIHVDGVLLHAISGSHAIGISPVSSILWKPNEDNVEALTTYKFIYSAENAIRGDLGHLIENANSPRLCPGCVLGKFVLVDRILAKHRGVERGRSAVSP
jgi:hypothetical protein